jgi:ketosteroid isomerase-like protein
VSNVDVVRRFWALWHDACFDELLAQYDDIFTEDLEWHSPVAEMSGRSYTGREGLARHLADLQETFTDINVDPTAIAEIAPNVVRSDVLIHAEGPTSGVTVDSPLVALARLRGGRVHWTWASFDLPAAEEMAAAVTRGEEVQA